ncbi:hypothetical protein ACTJJ0_30060 [Chitinophaga sp. 22321]|uniref:Uncharacterized protein n=1 Tax=Chitinophaga hostae TaxID=2831022 RepID=A0ABS5J8J4_9BACT|nr:hypothetical protein [Chitinophaga hostae]MBS0031378.1 hypothetical protein [Chitinophaga hostae]
MTDTPTHIKQLQLKIWLSKSPMERLKQMMEDNTALNAFWTATKEQKKKALSTNQ